MGGTSREGRNRIQSIMMFLGESRSTEDGSVTGEYFGRVLPPLVDCFCCCV